MTQRIQQCPGKVVSLVPFLLICTLSMSFLASIKSFVFLFIFLSIMWHGSGTNDIWKMWNVLLLPLICSLPLLYLPSAKRFVFLLQQILSAPVQPPILSTSHMTNLQSDGLPCLVHSHSQEVLEYKAQDFCRVSVLIASYTRFNRCPWIAFGI